MPAELFDKPGFADQSQVSGLGIELHDRTVAEGQAHRHATRCIEWSGEHVQRFPALNCDGPFHQPTFADVQSFDFASVDELQLPLLNPTASVIDPRHAFRLVQTGGDEVHADGSPDRHD
jgi:hypothetical protein